MSGALLSVVPVVYNNKLGPYLAGLIEGDGTIIVPTADKTTKGNNNYGYIQICFSAKDLPLAQYLQTLLGGHISLRTNSCTLTFKSRDNVIRVINLINGHMRTPKIEALHRLINWFNQKHNTLITPFGLDNTPLQDNSWLSGFFDADAGFYFNWNLSKKTGLPIRMAYNLRISLLRAGKNTIEIAL